MCPEERERREKEKPFDWSNPPPDLLPKAAREGGGPGCSQSPRACSCHPPCLAKSASAGGPPRQRDLSPRDARHGVAGPASRCWRAPQPVPAATKLRRPRARSPAPDDPQRDRIERGARGVAWAEPGWRALRSAPVGPPPQAEVKGGEAAYIEHFVRWSLGAWRKQARERGVRPAGDRSPEKWTEGRTGTPSRCNSAIPAKQAELIGSLDTQFLLGPRTN